jgi:hypothetical protein
MSRHRLGVTLFLVAAFASFLLSIALWFTDHREEGVFTGLWVPLQGAQPVEVVQSQPAFGRSVPGRHVLSRGPAGNLGLRTRPALPRVLSVAGNDSLAVSRSSGDGPASGLTNYPVA